MSTAPIDGQPGQPALVDSVLLIDGDNDPHFPPDFAFTPHTLVRVFLRPGAKMPRGLEKRIGSLPMCVVVSSPKGGGNAADFVMSCHAGILHATLPLHLAFTVVTHDKSLAVMVQELQRLGRQAVLWTSHPEPARGRRRASAATAEGAAPVAKRPRRGGRGRGGSRAAVPTLETEKRVAGTAAAIAMNLVDAAAAYAARLNRIKDPPSRQKALLNDIKNRAAGGHAPEAILEELIRSHGFSIDPRGKVTRTPPSAAA